MTVRVGEWYGCVVCGEMRPLVFEPNPDGPACQCRSSAAPPNRPSVLHDRVDAVPLYHTYRRDPRVPQIR